MLNKTLTLPAFYQDFTVLRCICSICKGTYRSDYHRFSCDCQEVLSSHKNI